HCLVLDFLAKIEGRGVEQLPVATAHKMTGERLVLQDEYPPGIDFFHRHRPELFRKPRRPLVHRVLTAIADLALYALELRARRHAPLRSCFTARELALGCRTIRLKPLRMPRVRDMLARGEHREIGRSPIHPDVFSGHALRLGLDLHLESGIPAAAFPL